MEVDGGEDEALARCRTVDNNGVCLSCYNENDYLY